MGFWQKLKKIYMGDVFGSAISEADEAFFDDLEEMLILADVGLETATEVVKELRQRMIEDKISGQEPVKACLREILAEKLQVGDGALNISTRPSVVLVVGVNGVGKTTSIGKLANSLRLEGKRVLLCAGDTFRAAAADQLEIWANRARCEIVRQKEGADPGAVLFDALQAARARGVDVVICDTAGRLHNKANLMASWPSCARSLTGSCRRRRWRSCWCWTPPPARTASSRPSSSRRSPAARASCSPSWTAPPRGALWWLSPRPSRCR